MKQIIIKSLKLVNFKGLRDYEVTFDSDLTSIYGKNGSGKTTLFDAFTWTLFGKDSEDRKQFNVKTLDETGAAIEKLPHEVTIVLSVDGKEITLTRRFTEKWTKRRGSAVEEFTGHTEERLYNDVPCSLKEWNEKIEEICSEQSFKFITSPTYFTAQKWEVQRAMLIRMAGDITDEEILLHRPEFSELVAELTGKTLEEYKREIANKKRRIKTEIDALPARIDERKRDSIEQLDWTAIEQEIAAKKKQLSDIEDQLTDAGKKLTEQNKERMSLLSQRSDLEAKKQEIAAKLKETALAGYYKEKAEQDRLKSEHGYKSEDATRLQREISQLRQESERISQRLTEFRDKWHAKKQETLQFDANDFICPTCLRPLETEDIEKKQQEMTERFNAKKAADLEEINKQGKQIKAELLSVESRIAEKEQQFKETEAAIKKIALDDLYQKTLVAPVVDIENDPQIKEITKKQQEISNKIESSLYNTEEDVTLKKQKAALSEEISTLTINLSKKDQIARNNERIAELEKQLREQSDELAALEKIEFTIAEYTKTRIEALESKIAGLFRHVRFKMYTQQINGGEAETCEAQVNGVPYSDLNHAAKINAGLDIIDAICKFEDISAPVFVDNAEAVNDLLAIGSQIIRLVVSEDPVLTKK